MKNKKLITEEDVQKAIIGRALELIDEPATVPAVFFCHLLAREIINQINDYPELAVIAGIHLIAIGTAELIGKARAIKIDSGDNIFRVG